MNYDIDAFWGFTIGLAALAIIILIVVGLCKLYNKAGEPGWKVFIPIYNLYILYKIADSVTLFIIYICCCVATVLIPVLSALTSIAFIVMQIIFCINLAKVFGKGGGFAVGLIFLYPIFVLILGFGSAQYVGSNGANWNVGQQQNNYNNQRNNYNNNNSNAQHNNYNNNNNNNGQRNNYNNNDQRSNYNNRNETAAMGHTVPVDPKDQPDRYAQDPRYLVGENGVYAGRRIELSSKQTLGTNPSLCEIRYPQGTPGVSGKHCTVRYQNGIVTVTDDGSTYGTWLDNRKLSPGDAVPFQPGQRLSLASTKETWILKA